MGTPLARELGWRTLFVGAAIGAVLAASNVYTGLKTAFVDGGSITAVILGYGLLRARAGDANLATRLNLVQATASSAAVMVAVIGLAGPWPALHSLGHPAPAWLLVVWGVALGTLGVVLAHALRTRLVERDALPFPTGAATAEVVRALTQQAGEGRRRAGVLALAAALAGTVAWAQQSAAWLPGEVALPLAWLGIEASVGVGLSPLVMATGALLGLRTAVAMAGTGVVVWAMIVPLVQQRGWIASAEFSDAIGFLMWPAVGLLVGEGLHSLVEHRPALRRSVVDLVRLAGPRERGSLRASSFASLFTIATILALGRFVLGVPVVLGVIALALALVLSAMIGRAAGETDVAPVGAAGALGQVTVGAHGVVASLVGGSIPCGVASQTAQGLWAFATTHALGLRARPVVVAQIVGVVVGAVVAVPVYELLVSTHGIGTESMPAWSAIAWAATATAVQQGAAAPAHAMPVALAALLAGFVAARRRARRPGTRVPSPTALAIGALTPSAFSAAVLVGAAALFVWSRRSSQSASAHGATVAAGCITGEALVAIVLALAAAW